MRSTHTKEGNRLYPKAADLNGDLKTSFTATPRRLLNQTTEHHSQVDT